jgi:hypothetical protein
VVRGVTRGVVRGVVRGVLRVAWCVWRGACGVVRVAHLEDEVVAQDLGVERRPSQVIDDTLHQKGRVVSSQ